jgi:hypothetical protein
MPICLSISSTCAHSIRFETCFLLVTSFGACWVRLRFALREESHHPFSALQFLNFSRAEIGKVGDSTEVSVSRRVVARGGLAEDPVVTGNIALASYRLSYTRPESCDCPRCKFHRMIERLKKEGPLTRCKASNRLGCSFRTLASLYSRCDLAPIVLGTSSFSSSTPWMRPWSR